MRLFLAVGLLNQQRVTCLGQLQRASLGDFRFGHLELIGVLRLGRQQVHVGDGPHGGGDLCRSRLDAHRQLVQQAQDFPPLVGVQVGQAVV